MRGKCRFRGFGVDGWDFLNVLRCGSGNSLAFHFGGMQCLVGGPGPNFASVFLKGC